MEIQLKRKYRTGLSYKSQKSQHSGSGKSHRHKASAAEKLLIKARQPEMVLLMQNGSTRMIQRKDLV